MGTVVLAVGVVGCVLLFVVGLVGLCACLVRLEAWELGLFEGLAGSGRLGYSD